MDIHIIESPFERPYNVLKTLQYPNDHGDWPDVEIVQIPYWEDFQRDYLAFARENKGKYPHMSFRQGRQIEWENSHA